ncbi:hypothetical protein [Duganella dendranthematis]|uniref:hypothetical protein n=1 Tax=Duganella dendranthematis TaxID=2728021 RepID=UPI001C2C5B5B|nr:hypothetical protein [Duganella dendranthematis]
MVEHEDADAHLVKALHSSKYLELWKDEFTRNFWQYNVALIEGHRGSDKRKRRYCEELLEDERLCKNRFILNHAGYVTVNTLYPRQYFEAKIDLYAALTEFHARRIKAATNWLERRGLAKSAPPSLLRPHTPEWFTSLREWNPKQAAMSEAAITAAGSLNVCSVCADDPARDYAMVRMPAAGPGTLKLCEDCFKLRSVDEPMNPF